MPESLIGDRTQIRNPCLLHGAWTPHGRQCDQFVVNRFDRLLEIVKIDVMRYSRGALIGNLKQEQLAVWYIPFAQTLDEPRYRVRLAAVTYRP